VRRFFFAPRRGKRRAEGSRNRARAAGEVSVIHCAKTTIGCLGLRFARPSVCRDNWKRLRPKKDARQPSDRVTTYAPLARKKELRKCE